MNCACTFTLTGAEELITASGKLNGLALIGMPLMLGTWSALGGVAGGATLNGVDCNGAGTTQFNATAIVVLNASRRIIPLLPLGPVASALPCTRPKSGAQEPPASPELLSRMAGAVKRDTPPHSPAPACGGNTHSGES